MKTYLVSYSENKNNSEIWDTYSQVSFLENYYDCKRFDIISHALDRLVLETLSKTKDFKIRILSEEDFLKKDLEKKFNHII